MSDRPPHRPRTWWRVVLAVILAIVVIVLLFLVVFPRVERYLQDPTLGLGRDSVTLASPR